MLPRGLEPRTLGLLDPRSDQLSYESACNVWGRSRAAQNNTTKMSQVTKVISLLIAQQENEKAKIKYGFAGT